MDRNEVLLGVEGVADFLAGNPRYMDRRYEQALRAAIDALRAPSDAEIETARAWLCTHDWIAFSGNGKPVTVFLEKALDALAAQSGLEADRDEWRTQHENALACWQTDKDTLGGQRDLAQREWADAQSQIAALELRLAVMTRDYDAARDNALPHASRVVGLEAKLAQVREMVREWRRQGVSLAAASELEDVLSDEPVL